MIISASRRTDIPACHAPWFYHRLAAGFVLVPNPMNPKSLRRVALDRESAAGFVFWSKNPAPLLANLDRLAGYPFYFQFTLNAYGPEVEGGLPPLAQRGDTLRRLGDCLGPRGVVWRYDPILLGPGYTLEWHLDTFGTLCARFAGHTDHCVISFLDRYRSIDKRLAAGYFRPPEPEEMATLGAGMARIAGAYGIGLSACAEAIDLTHLGIARGKCIDAKRLSDLAGRPLLPRKERNQRPHCGCDASYDIGMYDTCPLGCLYCYANPSRK